MACVCFGACSLHVFSRVALPAESFLCAARSCASPRFTLVPAYLVFPRVVGITGGNLAWAFVK